jgi:hypothetical protein
VRREAARYLYRWYRFNSIRLSGCLLPGIQGFCARLSIGGRQIDGVGEPTRAGLPARVDGRRSAWIVYQRSRWNDDLATTARGVRKRRATLTAKRRREAPRQSKVEARHMVLSGKPAEGLRQDIRVCRKRAAGCPAAPGTMTLNELGERQIDLKLHQSAETSAARRHAPFSMVCSAFLLPGAQVTRHRAVVLPLNGLLAAAR